jgi:hypothetical protein
MLGGSLNNIPKWLRHHPGHKGSASHLSRDLVPPLTGQPQGQRILIHGIRPEGAACEARLFYPEKTPYDTTLKVAVAICTTNLITLEHLGPPLENLRDMLSAKSQEMSVLLSGLRRRRVCCAH